MTGMPHRPSSTDGQSPVSVFVSSSFNPIGLPQEIARRYARRRLAVAIARTVRHEPRETSTYDCRRLAISREYVKM